MHYREVTQGWALAAGPPASREHQPARSSPSQNPDPAAQQPIDEVHAARERRTVFLGGALLAGVALGAAVGTAVAGPLGVLLGGSVGAVFGGIGGMAIAGQNA